MDSTSARPCARCGKRRDDYVVWGSDEGKAVRVCGFCEVSQATLAAKAEKEKR